MKRFWKFALFTILIIILAGGGTLYYFLNVKTYDVADEEIEEITDTGYEISLPGENETVIIKNEEDKQETKKSVDDKTADSTSSDKAATQNSSKQSKDNSAGSVATKKEENTSNKSKEAEVTVAIIKDRYRPTFESLEAQANQKIDSLLSKAINEYKTKQSNGEAISYMYFYQKYSSAGRQLESQTDAAFNYIYKSLEKELSNNGFSTSHAKTFKEEYEKAKSTREGSLFSMAKEAL